MNHYIDLMYIIILFILVIIIYVSFHRNPFCRNQFRGAEPYQSTFGYNTFKIHKNMQFYNQDVYRDKYGGPGHTFSASYWSPFTYGYFGAEKYHYLTPEFSPYSFYGNPNSFYKKFHGYVPRTVQPKRLSDPDYSHDLVKRCERYAKYLCRNKNKDRYYHCINREMDECLDKY